MTRRFPDSLVELEDEDRAKQNSKPIVAVFATALIGWRKRSKLNDTGARNGAKRRTRQGLPVISIVGYTNAGKSTLLNALTRSDVLAEQRMFATLDPTSRRLRLPREQEVIINDTVGFIRNLPPDLLSAFRATLEEISDSSLLIHAVDVSNPRWPQQVLFSKKNSG